jgi:alpha-glucosidase
MKKVLYTLVMVCAVLSCKSNKRAAIVSSPGNTTSIAITIDNERNDQLFFAVKYLGKEVIAPSMFQLSIEGEPVIGANLVIGSVEKKEINETWERVWGRSKQVLNHFNEVILTLKETTEPFRSFNLIARAYDDGVGFRYSLPGTAGDSIRLASEDIEFNFTDDHRVWTSVQQEFKSAQEKEWIKPRISELKPGEILVTPLLVQLQNGWAALLEANLTNWAGMYLTAGKAEGLGVKTLLSPLPEEEGIALISDGGMYSPWRVVMLGEKAGDLIVSNLLHNLNEPSDFEDVSWIRPGRCAWDAWWCGGYAPAFGRQLGYDTESMKYFIDLASEMGWEYQLVDWLWYKSVDAKYQPYPDSDITRPVPEIDMPELLRYAESKNVKLILWLHWWHAARQMDEAFPLYEKWGIAGLKIDFMNRNDQEMVNQCRRFIEKAAEHKMVIDFHGAYMPTGIDRTYPNFLTREGIMGNEFNKWSAKVSPEHCVTIPFTRMLGGQMDFTPGGFNHAPFGTFSPSGFDTPNPLVLGTRCFQLAMPVVYESALTVFCDSPDNYRGQEGIEFYKIVPTTWDDTKVIDGFPGEFIIIARKHGADWFMGAMTNDEERNLEIPLSFLEEGTFKATIYSDSPDADKFPAKLVKTERNVTAGETISVKLAHGGGCAVHFDKLD